MSVSDLNARRWADNERTDAHKPIAALKEAIRQIETGELQADHVIIAIGSAEDGGDITNWLQAGSFDTFAQRGLMAGVLLRMFAEAGCA